jgi:two-component system response regulator (stage 0 sporulation protein F)
MNQRQRDRDMKRRSAKLAVPQRRLLPPGRQAPVGRQRADNRFGISWIEGDKMKTILLIDHNLEHLLYHNELLGRAGYRVVTARDGRSALFIIESGMALDLIVTECDLPDMDSGEFLGILGKKAPTAPVIVVTGCDSVKGYIQAITLGAYEYLSKPVFAGELRSVVGAAIEAHRHGGLAAGPA